MDKQYLTEKEVTELTGIGRNTLTHWRFYKKNLPYLKLGESKSSKVLYERKVVEDFLKSRNIEAEE